MNETPDLPPEIEAFVEPCYVDAFGTVPPIPNERLRTGAALDPALTLASEEARRSALFSDVFDNKTAQLLVVAIMAGTGSPGLKWHVLAARRYGATWQELYKTIEIAAFFKGFGALQEGGLEVGRLWREEEGGTGTR